MEDRYRVYVSKEEWERLSELAQLELIALSMMTGEEIENTLTGKLRNKYLRLMEDE
jgi:translation initiation factor IF-1